MKVIALVSGGKDSTFNMLECVRYGHQLIALGNLYPADTSKDDIDSFMFQTVGHNVIDAYATCTGLPLFREPIRGEARQQALQYEAAAGDEVEDLFALLARAKAALPELEAVACGAILSTYQRTRVESVCSRLGLVSLAFLWQRDQRALLAEMVATPVAAILIKTAAMGLEPRRHLGRTIAELQPQLLELEQRYGLNVCGEGGEYETLTLDCPLFVKRLVIDQFELVGDLRSSIAAVACVHVTRFHVEDKPAGQVEQELAELRRRWAADDARRLAPPEEGALPTPPPFGPPQPLNVRPEAFVVDQAAQEAARSALECRCASTNSLAALSVWYRRGGQVGSAGESVPMAMTAAQDALKRVGLELRHVLYARLFVRSLVDYAVVNAAYRGFFALHPPSRCAVEACLGARDTPILLELLASPLERSVLHVQSVSCWAPSNIGPYSQASTLSGVVFLAGVIALDPPTMQIVHAQSVAAQTRRCLQSCSAILSATRSSLDSLAGAVVYHTDHAAHEVATELARGLARESAPPALLVRVPALPRAALVEIELVALEARLAAKAALVSHALPSRHPAAFASLAREAGAVFALALVVIDAPELVASAAGSRELSTLADETARAVRDVIANNAAVLARHLVSCQVFFRADLAATNFEAELRVAMERAVGSSCVSATPVLDVAVCDLRDSTKTLRRGLVAVRLLAMDTAAADVLVAPRA